MRFVQEHSLLLLVGAATALIWANVDPASYDVVAGVLRFGVNDIGMAFFFALAAAEVVHATNPGGSLASPRHVLAPVAGAVGGMVVPALIFGGLVAWRGPNELARGWAIPCATDIAFSATVARALFPHRHPAISFLLLMAIIDDALGLVVLAAFYPTGSISIASLMLLMAAALLFATWLRAHTRSFWPYILGAGSLSWAALYLGGFHPALALVPIVPLMSSRARRQPDSEVPHKRSAGPLNRFEEWWAIPVQFILLLFGFANAGVRFAQIGPGTYYVLAGLLVGKPVGILIFSGLARFVGARVPADIDVKELAVIGLTASIGFTVSLFFATAAFPSGNALTQTKMGAVLSLIAAPLILAAFRIRPRRASG